jgi:tetratricopeptide (TPR) repeat protein
LPEAHFNIGITYSRLKQKDEALAACKRAVELKPDWPAAQNNLGFAYGQLGKWKEAIAAHQEAIRLKPDYAGAHFNLGFAYLNSGNKKAAEEEYKTLKPLSLGLANQLYFFIYKKQPPKN